MNYVKITLIIYKNICKKFFYDRVYVLNELYKYVLTSFGHVLNGLFKNFESSTILERTYIYINEKSIEWVLDKYEIHIKVANGLKLISWSWSRKLSRVRAPIWKPIKFIVLTRVNHTQWILQQKNLPNKAPNSYTKIIVGSLSLHP